MKTSVENKSKILKLTNEQNKLKSWIKNGDWILIGNAFLSLVPFSIFTSINFGIGLTIFAISYTSLSVVSLLVNHAFKDGARKRIGEIDQEILELVKTNDDEFMILKEYHKVQDMQNKLNTQKRLLEEMIEKKYNKNHNKKIVKPIQEEFEDNNDLLI